MSDYHFYDRNPEFASRMMFLCPDGRRITYQEGWEYGDAILGQVPEGSLVFIMSRNAPASVTAYLACLRKRCVPLLLQGDLAAERLDVLVRTYHPGYVLMPADREEAKKAEEGAALRQDSGEDEKKAAILWRDDEYVMTATGKTGPALHPELALLLSTSGSTGSPKLVRISRANMQKNAEQIAEYLELTQQERPVTSLPMEYTYGLSVINSHLLVGAQILLTEAGILDGSFWNFVRNGGATSFAGVPYSYSLLERLRFFEMDLPSLRSLTQAGGHLKPAVQERFAAWSAEHGIRFYVMYGQTEATARMSWLPPAKCMEKAGSIGIPIPDGRFALLQEDGTESNEAGAAGELVYYGENVTLGYAVKAEDLQLGDVNGGRLLTGDLARVDEDGYYYITGRKKRFVKMAGKRVSLDELEQMLPEWNLSYSYLCTGTDDCVRVFVIGGAARTEEQKAEEAASVRDFLSRGTGLRGRSFHVGFLNEIPRNLSGKVAYDRLLDVPTD